VQELDHEVTGAIARIESMAQLADQMGVAGQMERRAS